MPYVLKINTGDVSETQEVRGEHLKIGRDPSCDLCLDDERVSAQHAEIVPEDEGYVLADQESAAGTYSGDRRIQRLLLFDGDQITIGPFTLGVHLRGAGESLELEVNRSAAGLGSGIEPEKVAYSAAYGLRQGWLNQTILSLGAALLTAAAIAAFVWEDKHEIFRPGAVSAAHALVTDQCTRCHVPWHGPSTRACVACHSGPLHHAEQAFTPECGTCHAEHRARRELARVVDQQCVTCHGALKTKSGDAVRFAAAITDFTLDHPEFSITTRSGDEKRRISLREGGKQADPAVIDFNHRVHVEPGLMGPAGAVTLRCNDCHQPSRDGRLMATVGYAPHCSECHRLDFDPQLPGREVPHDTPETVRAYLVRTYGELQGEIVPYPERRRLAGKPRAKELSPAIIDKVMESEAVLFSDARCGKCHELSKEKGELPRVQAPGIPSAWFPHAVFSHKAHRMLQCASCHEGVSESSRTSDVLLPGIETCQPCHRSAAAGALLQRATATADCVVCHLYHDKSEQRAWTGTLTVQGVLEMGEKDIPKPEREPSYVRYLRTLGLGWFDLGKSER